MRLLMGSPGRISQASNHTRTPSARSLSASSRTTASSALLWLRKTSQGKKAAMGSAQPLGAAGGAGQGKIWPGVPAWSQGTGNARGAIPWPAQQGRCGSGKRLAAADSIATPSQVWIASLLRNSP
jgi:hypothetical protein